MRTADQTATLSRMILIFQPPEIPKSSVSPHRKSSPKLHRARKGNDCNGQWIIDNEHIPRNAAPLSIVHYPLSIPVLSTPHASDARARCPRPERSASPAAGSVP